MILWGQNWNIILNKKLNHSFKMISKELVPTFNNLIPL